MSTTETELIDFKAKDLQRLFRVPYPKTEPTEPIPNRSGSVLPNAQREVDAAHRVA